MTSNQFEVKDIYLKTTQFILIMARKKLLLINLEEDQAKQVAQVITNETSRKILDYLADADKESTETELSEHLNIPLSTVHYNLQQLIKSGLVVAEEYHYSKRGKEVNHYKLANQYIIIAPKNVSTKGLKSKLRSLLPIALVSLVGTAFIHIYQNYFRRASGSAMKSVGDTAQYDIAREGGKQVIQEVADSTAAAATTGAQEIVATTAATGAEEVASTAATNAAENIAADTVAPALNNTISKVSDVAPEAINEAVKTTVDKTPEIAQTIPNYALWFLAGCIFVIILIIIIELIKKAVKKGDSE